MDRGLVEHEGTYWAVTDDAERLDGDSGYERVITLFDEHPGEEDTEAWREHAPSEIHPDAENEQ